jgi:hypothetical protein
MIDPTTEVKIDSAPNPVDKTALSLLDGIPEELAAGIAQLLCDKRISTIKLGSYIGQGYARLAFLISQQTDFQLCRS